MNTIEILQTTADLIALRALQGAEQCVIGYVQALFEKFGWRVEHLAVDETRNELFVAFGTPKIVFTTHLDVVAGPEGMFNPIVKDGVLKGRGSCDAQGIAVTMIAVCETLLARGMSDFGLLLVIEEETTGLGARRAAQALKDRGIRVLIAGEPTENKIITATKGGLGGLVRFSGKSCHSGYPELGEDANKKLLGCAAALGGLDFGADPILGLATINIGTIQGGSGINIISSSAELSFLVRTIGSNRDAQAMIEKVVGPFGSMQITYDCEPARMLSVPGFTNGVAAFCTDIPNFAALGADSVLFGPGSIDRAHTDAEFVTQLEIQEALEGYLRIFSFLKTDERYLQGAIH